MEICYIIISCTYIYIYVSSDYLATGLLSGSSTSVNRLPPHVHMRRPHSGLYNLLVVNMRHRIVCGIACGIHHEVSAVDLATLTEAEYIRHPP